jgi:hypothetical protein
MPPLKHIPVRLRVSVDPARWTERYGTPAADIPDAVRRLAVTLMQESAAAQAGAIVSVRRAGL